MWHHFTLCIQWRYSTRSENLRLLRVLCSPYCVLREGSKFSSEQRSIDVMWMQSSGSERQSVTTANEQRKEKHREWEGVRERGREREAARRTRKDGHSDPVRGTLEEYLSSDGRRYVSAIAVSIRQLDKRLFAVSISLVVRATVPSDGQ